MNEGTEIPSVDSTLKILSIQLFLLRADTAPTKDQPTPQQQGLEYPVALKLPNAD